jgi:hypothetical protein
LQYYDELDQMTSNNRRFTLGIPLRAGFGIGTGVFGIELGLVAGGTYASLTSNVCPSESRLRLVLGGYPGPVVRLGSERQIRIAAQFQMISPISPKCTNWDGSMTSDQVSLHPVWFYDSPPNPSIAGQLATAW